MRIGVVFPQSEIGADAGYLRDFVQTIESIGYSHLLLYDHVLGVDPERRPDWSADTPPGPYTYRDGFHEPFAFLSWAAGLTSQLELVTGILILPQRQTALVAKQAAELDILSQGRLRLGVGLGWNAAEYEGLGEDFSSRGRRMEAQIGLLRRLWAEDTIDYEDEWHGLKGVGINPRPVRKIPVWIGGMSERAVRRAARVGDGWFPQFTPGPEAERMLKDLRGYLREEGRDPAEFGIEGRMSVGRPETERQVQRARQWQDLGIDTVSVNTMRAGLEPPDHLTALERFMQAWDAEGLA